MSDKPNRRGGGAGPTRTQSDLADVVELLLDKGIVINADIAVSIGDAELLGIQIRAAIASFETAAKYGLEFPSGTDTERIEEAAGVDSIDDDSEGENGDEVAVERADVGDRIMGLHEPPVSESSPAMSGPPISEPDEDTENTENTENADVDGDNGNDGEGPSGVIDGTNDVVSGEGSETTGSEPGVRQRPTAPNAEDSSDADGSNSADSDSDSDFDSEAEADETDADETDTGDDQ